MAAIQNSDALSVFQSLEVPAKAQDLDALVAAWFAKNFPAPALPPKPRPPALPPKPRAAANFIPHPPNEFFVYTPLPPFKACPICLVDDLNSKELQTEGKVLVRIADGVRHAFHRNCVNPAALRIAKP